MLKATGWVIVVLLTALLAVALTRTFLALPNANSGDVISGYQPQAKNTLIAPDEVQKDDFGRDHLQSDKGYTPIHDLPRSRGK